MARIMAAMSGGVDSSVAALLLRQQGHTVSGVTMCLGTAQLAGEHPACCGPEAVRDARRVCDTLDIPHHVFDFSAELQQHVIAPFVHAYASGRTPNPCVWCNSRLKFGSLLLRARAMGFDALATGHYARIACGTGGCSLHTAADTTKDQTYFLCGIERSALRSIALPLARLTKRKVRELAGAYGLPVADKQESQDICFVPSAGSYRTLISPHVRTAPGNFVDSTGTVLGRHAGITDYTVGQRKGLGIAASHPLYVLRLDIERNEVVLGRRGELLAQGLTATGVNLLCDSLPANAEVRIRYSAPRVPAHLSHADDTLTVRFVQPQEAITPGQALAIYSGNTVLAGATIATAIHAG